LNTLKRNSLTLSFLLLAVAGFPAPAKGWDIHRSLMPEILQGAPARIQEAIKKEVPTPCENEDRLVFEKLIFQLQLNPKSHIPPTFSGNCSSKTKVFIKTLLLGSSVDDPDQGMDRDLSSSTLDMKLDPNGDRQWMGGTPGPSSQGFRHMYFGGWKINHPMITFQIPTRPLGQAPERAQIMAQMAKHLIKEGQVAWGIRTTAWALHYLQDLAQPFHSAQLISLKMVPWSTLLSWPPQEGFKQLVKETTRIITNYHWAYEGYVLDRLSQGENSPFKECLSKPENYSKINFNHKTQTISELAHITAQASIQIASQLGSSEYDFFGSQLAEPNVSLTLNPHLLDYSAYATRPDLQKTRETLHHVTCQALANAALASQKLLEWVFEGEMAQ
jgi:hypothetical protein